MKQLNKYFIAFILTLYSTLCFSQKWNLIVEENDSNLFLVNKLNFKKEFNDSILLEKEIQLIINSLHEKSYLMAHVINKKIKGKNVFVKFSIGEPYNWLKLNTNSVPISLLKKIDFRERFFKNKSFSYTLLVKYEKRLLKYAEENGYPFAITYLDSIFIENEKEIHAALQFDKGPQILFDSIIVMGKSNIKPKFLSAYLQIQKGSYYDERKIRDAENLIKKLNITKIAHPMEVRYNNEKAKVFLFLEDKKSNYIDGLVGLQQDNKNNDKLLLTGEFNIKLRNMGGSGKGAAIQWKKTDRYSQLLNLSYKHPSLLKSNVNFEFFFDLLKQDTTFLTLNSRFDFKYNLGKNSQFGVFYQNTTSRLSSPKMFENASKLPEFADSKLNMYGTNIEWNNLDDYYFPKKGFLFWTEASVGQKRIIQTLNKELYKETNLKSIYYRIDSRVEYHLKASDLLTFMFRSKNGYIDNKKLFLNEMYRLGGLNSIRGFRENSFYASSFSISTFETRFFTENESYLLAFVDYALVNTKTTERTEKINPIGFGAGLSISTKAGIFNMVYALNYDKNSGVNPNTSVINFGITSRF